MHRRIIQFFGVALLFGLALAGAPALAANSVVHTFAVNSTADLTDTKPGDGKCRTSANTCTLRAAIQEANKLGSGTIDLPVGIYTLTLSGKFEDKGATGDLDIRGDLNIIGTNAVDTVIQGKSGWNDRILHVVFGNVTISNVTIKNGSTFGTGEDGAGVEIYGGGNVHLVKDAITGNSSLEFGSGVANNGTLVVRKSLITANTGAAGILNDNGSLRIVKSTISNNDSDGDGGGIEIDLGKVVVNKSTINGNHTLYGGGGISNYHATLSVTNSTINGNTSDGDGGGIYNWNTGTTNLLNTTISANEADNDASATGSGGGIMNTSNSTIYLENSILAGNRFGTKIGTSPDCAWTLASHDYNVIGSTLGCNFLGKAHDQLNINPLLLGLADNGGLTFTQALGASSPALDAIPSGKNSCGTKLTTDQRGKPRPVNHKCDIGAVEMP